MTTSPSPAPALSVTAASAWHAREPDAVLLAFASRRDGLTDTEVAERLLRDGPNRLPAAADPGALALLARQFADFMIGVLFVAAAVAAAIGEPVEAAAILAIVVLNAVLGFAQEWRAQKAMAALRALSAPRARVIRDGVRQDIEAADLVLGDVVWLEAGARVPADLRLIESAALRVEEAALTGESVPSGKNAAVTLPADTPLAERENLAYAGTLVTAGRGIGAVIATAGNTELGGIARLVDALVEQATPLQSRLARFGRRLAVLVLAICAVIFVTGLARGEPAALMFLTAVSLAVAAIPEALPAVVSIALALGAHRMSRAHALVRRLPCVESLGSVTVICSDKTGTLTENRLRVDRLELVHESDRARALQVLALNSDATRDHEGRWAGDPTETALVEAAAEAGVDVDALRDFNPRIAELPFDSSTQRMSTLHAADDAALLTVKGAPESVLPICINIDQALWERRAQQLAAAGQRVLALAARPARLDEPIDRLHHALELVALVGLIDAARPEAARAVAECGAAGIVPIMITGDHPATALAIARTLGIAESGSQAMSGRELAALDAAGTARMCRTRTGLRARRPGAEDPDRRGFAGARRMRRDDRRRRQRCAGAAQGRHRRLDGPRRNRRCARSLGPRAARRQFRHDRRGGARGPPHLRQHPQVRALRHGRQRGRDLDDLPRPSARPAASADADPDPVGQFRDRWPAGARTARASRPRPMSCSGLRVRATSRSSRMACGSTSSGPGC